MGTIGRLQRLMQPREKKQETRNQNNKRAERLQAEVAKIQFWYHTVDLGDGVVTPWLCRHEVGRERRFDWNAAESRRQVSQS
jgi:hypothetical protein